MRLQCCLEKNWEMERNADMQRYPHDLHDLYDLHDTRECHIWYPWTPAFRKYSTCWILQKFQESCRNFQKKHVFFGKTFPNLWTHSPTPGFLWDLGTQKVKFRFKKKARLGGLGFSHPTHPILGKFPPKKNTLIFGPSITKGKGWDGVTRYTPTWQQLKLALLVISEPL